MRHKYYRQTRDQKQADGRNSQSGSSSCLASRIDDFDSPSRQETDQSDIGSGFLRHYLAFKKHLLFALFDHDPLAILQSNIFQKYQQKMGHYFPKQSIKRQLSSSQSSQQSVNDAWQNQINQLEIEKAHQKVQVRVVTRRSKSVELQNRLQKQAINLKQMSNVQLAIWSNAMQKVKDVCSHQLGSNHIEHFKLSTIIEKQGLKTQQSMNRTKSHNKINSQNQLNIEVTKFSCSQQPTDDDDELSRFLSECPCIDDYVVKKIKSLVWNRIGQLKNRYDEQSIQNEQLLNEIRLNKQTMEHQAMQIKQLTDNPNQYQDKELEHLLREKQMNKKLFELKAQIESLKRQLEQAQSINKEQLSWKKTTWSGNQESNMILLRERINLQTVRRSTALCLQQWQQNLSRDC